MPAGNFVFTDAFVSINGVDLSDNVREAELDFSAELQDDTVMGDETMSNLAGAKNWRVRVRFLQNYSAAKVDATIFPLVGAAAFTWILRPDKSDGVGVTNPNFVATGVIESYRPVGGTYGQMLETEVVILPGGASNALARNTV